MGAKERDELGGGRGARGSVARGGVLSIHTAFEGVTWSNGERRVAVGTDRVTLVALADWNQVRQEDQVTPRHSLVLGWAIHRLVREVCMGVDWVGLVD